MAARRSTKATSDSHEDGGGKAKTIKLNPKSRISLTYPRKTTIKEVTQKNLEDINKLTNDSENTKFNHFHIA